MASFLNFAFLFASLNMPTIKDHGVHSQTFHIEEENLIDYLEARFKNEPPRIIKAHSTPQAVAGLKKAESYAVHYFDPTIILKDDIQDIEGKIIIPKGTSYNPLEHISLSQSLLFFDGDQKEHIQWAKSQKEGSKWILVKGNPFELQAQENYPVFFDQNGMMVKKFSISTIPAKVTQECNRLKVEALPLQESACGS